MRKRISALLIALIVLVGLLPMSALAEGAADTPYVYSNGVSDGCNYILAYDNGEGYAVVANQDGNLVVETLSELTTATVQKTMLWTVTGVSGHAIENNGMYLTAEGGTIALTGRHSNGWNYDGWEGDVYYATPYEIHLLTVANGSVCAYDGDYYAADGRVAFYALKGEEVSSLPPAKAPSRAPSLGAESGTGGTAKGAADDGLTVLAFTSDTHNKEGNAAANRLGTWLDIIAGKYGSNVDAMAFGGDMASASASESAFWTLTQADMDQLTARGVTGVYTTGNHEYSPGAYTNGKNSTTQVYVENQEGIEGSNYHIYCLGSSAYAESGGGGGWSMGGWNKYTASQVTALTNYLNSIDDEKPIFVITHYPLHYTSSRTIDGSGDVIDALNSAAASGKKIVYLWGHNHTDAPRTETNYDKIFKPGDTITYKSGSTKTINFYYGAAGCMSDSEYGTGSGSVKGKGLVVTINSENQLSFTYYNASGTDVTEGGTYSETGGGGYTPVDPPVVDDTVSITPTTSNPELSAAIDIGDTLVITVTNGSSNSAYDFTATLSSSGVAQIQGSATVNIAAGGTGTFTVTGLTAGTVDITIQNSNTYGSQYARKGIIHLTVGGGGSTPVDPPVVGDTVEITPSTDNPEASAQIQVGDTLVITVTNGSSNSAYDFTATLSSSGVAQIQGSATVNIAAGGTGTFTVTGLTAGTVDITIQNSNTYGSQYARKGTIHLTVGEGGSQPPSGDGVTYIQTDTFVDGKEYIIVNGDTGSVYVVSNTSTGSGTNTGLVGISATVSGGKITLSAANAAKAAFTCEIKTSSSGAVSAWLKQGSNYLYTASSGGLRISNEQTSSSNTGKFWHYKAEGKDLLWFFKDTTSSDGYTDTSSTYKYYLNCSSSGTFTSAHVSTISLANTSTPVIYLFVKDDGTAQITYTFNNFTWTGNDASGYTAAVANYTGSDGSAKTVDAIVTSDITAATCIAAGSTVYTATVTAANSLDEQGHTDARTVSTPALGHDYGEWALTTPATCAAEGVETRECSRCDATETRSIPALGHDYETVATDPTCTAGGYKTHTCSVCGDSYIDTETEALGHIWGEAEYSWAEDYSSVTATHICTREGCTCEETETSLPVKRSISEPTCETAGQVMYIATFDNDAFQMATEIGLVPALGHAWGEAEYVWSEDNSSVTATRVCTRDGSHTETETADVSMSIKKESTCEAEGEAVYTAEFANEAFTVSPKTEALAKLPHSYGRPVWGWDGYNTAFVILTCANCGERETIQAAITAISVEATCTENGETIYTASVEVNGKTYTDSRREILPMLEHTPGEAVREDEVPATVTAEGSYDEVVYCAVCHAELSRTHKTIDKLPIPLAINIQPYDQTVAAGKTATFTVAASGEGLTYQWQYSNNGGATWKNKTGATTASYTVTTKASYDGMRYRCKVTDSTGNTVTSDEAKLTIIPKPVITAQPSDQTVLAGKTAAFTVAASGEEVTYQWQYSNDGGSSWHNKTGATATTYTVTAKASYDGMLYRCKVTNGGGSVYTSTAKLTVVSISKPVITAQPSDKTVSAGEAATFTVAASGEELTYQWQYSNDGGSSWHNKTGATATTYTVTAKTSYDGMLYRCKVTNGGGSVYTATAKLTVTAVVAPAIAAQPRAQTAAVGETAAFTVAASGTGLQYQWQYSNNNGLTWTNKTGSTSATHTVTVKASYNGMLYRCVIKNSAGSVTTEAVRLTVDGVKPKIMTQPEAKTAAAGKTATFEVDAAGTGLTYQWQYSTDGGTTWKNKTGATSAAYTVTAKASYNGILYRCRVKNSYGTVYSESAVLTVG